MSRELTNDLEKVLEYVAHACAGKGYPLDVAVLACSKARIEWTGVDEKYSDDFNDLYTIYLEVPQTLYDQLEGVDLTEGWFEYLAVYFIREHDSGRYDRQRIHRVRITKKGSSGNSARRFHNDVSRCVIMS